MDGSEGLDWNGMIAAMNIGGFVRELANNLWLEKREDDSFHLVIDPSHTQLLNKERESSLRAALAALVGRDVRISIRTDKSGGETPAREKQRQKDERQQAAEQSILSDPNVKSLMDQLDARVNPASIRPKA
ncbi:MAG: hypothetical protein A2140_08465 [Candidatus Muproteobacteria bacterium RBG_16_62_13]|uniref:DNA polymerase III tau subunit domain-containing protein n=1 Tax=Candidatus Muproteobacteria bacterium RBG_16_62_13 TaxID=1817756 RepID=A0A1F6T3K1_9PROT|nr:MAG: hypothetical protein A2140_08465 [Candidatus Muproteobacteria bacterium RBG_16_62_13]